MRPGQKAHLFPGQVTVELRKLRTQRINAALAAGTLKRPPVGEFLERDKRSWWWINPPEGRAADYEWAHYCWQTRNQRLDRRDRVETAQSTPKTPSGATAGWRRSKPPLP